MTSLQGTEQQEDKQPMCGPTTTESTVQSDDAPNLNHHQIEQEEEQVVMPDFSHLNSAVAEDRPQFLSDDDNNDDKQDASPSQSSCTKSTCKWLLNFYFDNEFLLLVILAIVIARAYPPLGATYLAPEITATWIAVIFIFVLAGLGLKTAELTRAFQRVYFNAFVQIYNFGVVSSIVFGFSRGMKAAGAISQNLADGMVICACLPLTINMVMVLTKTAGGDEAAAIFNAAFGNLVGVFLSPLLILGYIGVTGDINMGDVFYKLALRVIAPVFVGQVLQKTSKRVVNFVAKYKKWFKKAQMYTLVFIVYTVFCKTFDNDTVSSVGEIFIMIAFQLIMLLIVMTLAWYLLKVFFPNEPKLRVMGLFGCTHKTVAMGVPLINAIYENDVNVGVYTLPLLIWHPMQLVIGSALAPRLSAFVDREKARLGIVDDDDDDDGDGHQLPVTRSDEDQQQEHTNDGSSSAGEQEEVEQSSDDVRDTESKPGDEEAP